jgi:hypothetical protein
MCNGVLIFIHFESCRASLSWMIQYMLLLVILVIGNYFSVYSLCALFCHLADTGLIFAYLICGFTGVLTFFIYIYISNGY